MRIVRHFLTFSIVPLFVLLNSYSYAYAADSVETALHIIVTLCLAGGHFSVSKSVYTPLGGSFHLESDKGSFTVESRDAWGLIDGLGKPIDGVAAEQANRARDCMKTYIPQALAIAIGDKPAVGGSTLNKIQPVTADTRLFGTSVYYYLKTADGTKVTDALKAKYISFTQVASVLPDRLHSNTILCGRNVNVKAIKALAIALIDGGVPLQVIRVPPKNPNSSSLAVASIPSLNGNDMVSKPLSRSQIQAITACPQTVDDIIANFIKFTNPRPSGRSDDERYIDVWLTPDENSGGWEAADKFCKNRGYTAAARWSSGNLEDEGDIALYLGDNRTCQGQDCRVFTSIDCQ